MARRKSPRKVIRRVITFKVNGRIVKTTRQKITLRQAIREVGEDRWLTKGDSHTFTRRVGIVLVAFSYTAVSDLIEDMSHTLNIDPSSSVLVARGGLVG